MRKTVFVTGSTAGTGYVIAETFAKAGYSVILTSREQDKADEAARRIAHDHGVFAKGYALGFRDEERVKEIFRDIDANDCFVETLVLNAADLGYGTDPAKGLDFFTQSVEEFQQVLETNLVWNFMIVRQAAIRMREQGKGSVVFLSSNTAHRSIPNRAAYCASKGGINALVKAFALDLGRYGIRVNAILPGTIKTERWKKMGSKQIVNGELTPIGDITDYEDLANAAFYLGTDLSKNVTGIELPVDGGMMCQLYPELLTTLKKEKLEREG